MIARRATAVALLVLALGIAPGAAIAACPRASLAELENEVMCPVCKTPLALAQEAPQANRERAFILERVERCQSKGQIKAALTAEFGDEVLALPERRGFDLAAYLVPALALAVALGVAAVATVRWRRRRPRPSAGTVLVEGEGEGTSSAAVPGKPSPSATARLERELEAFDG